MAHSSDAPLNPLNAMDPAATDRVDAATLSAAPVVNRTASTETDLEPKKSLDAEDVPVRTPEEQAREDKYLKGGRISMLRPSKRLGCLSDLSTQPNLRSSSAECCCRFC